MHPSSFFWTNTKVWLATLLVVSACAGSAANPVPEDGAPPLGDAGPNGNDGSVANSPDARTDPSNEGGLDACVPRTCASVGAACGELSDGCGGTLACGACQWSGRCNQNRCVDADTLTVYLSNIADQGSGDTFTRRWTGGSVSFSHPVTQPSCANVIRQEGGCTVTKTIFDEPGCDYVNSSYSGDAGTITVSGGQPDPIRFTPSADAGLQSNIPADAPQLWTGGELLSVSSTGGTEYAAFSITVLAPSQPVIHTSEIKRGATVDIQWSPAETNSDVNLAFVVYEKEAEKNGAIAILCNVPDTGRYRFSETLTSTLPTSPTGVNYFQIYRYKQTHLEPPARSHVVLALTNATTMRTIQYSP